MKPKDKVDRAYRLGQRDALIRELFLELRNENESFMECYAFLGDVFGLGDSQLSRIINHPKNEFVLSTNQVRHLAVLLQRILENKKYGRRKFD